LREIIDIFLNCLLPESVYPGRSRSMPIRNVDYFVQAKTAEEQKKKIIISNNIDDYVDTYIIFLI